MQRISFHSPTSTDEVCHLLRERPRETRVIAGGQSLIQMLKQRLVSAETIVDISSLAELKGIRHEDDRLWIGAGETYADVRDHELVREHLPILPAVISTIGDTQIRNRGTLVGGIAHADPQGDPPVAAVGLDATVRIRSADGEREVSAREFHCGLFETTLEQDELITEVGFPVRENRTATFQSFTPREGDYAVASVLATAPADDSVPLADVEITLGAVGDYPQVVSGADIGFGEPELSAADRKSVGKAVADTVTVNGDEEWSESYRARLVEHLVAEALEDIGIWV